MLAASVGAIGRPLCPAVWRGAFSPVPAAAAWLGLEEVVVCSGQGRCAPAGAERNARRAEVATPGVQTQIVSAALHAPHPLPLCCHAWSAARPPASRPQAFPAHLLDAGMVGIATLGGTALGVLFPLRHPQAPQIVLNLAVVPNTKGA